MKNFPQNISPEDIEAIRQKFGGLRKLAAQVGQIAVQNAIAKQAASVSGVGAAGRAASPSTVRSPRQPSEANAAREDWPKFIPLPDDSLHE